MSHCVALPLPLPFDGGSFQGLSVGALSLGLVRVGMGGEVWGGGGRGFVRTGFRVVVVVVVVGPFSKVWRTRR